MRNDALAALFIVLALLSAGVNGWFLLVTSADATGNAVASARACINKPPIPNASGCGYAMELSTYECTITTFDSDESQSRSFFDNTSLFDITDSGVMSFYPQYGDRGTYPIEITVIDDSSCPNAVQTGSFVLIIRPYPANDSLNITDTTQTNTTYKLEPVLFTANYTNVTSNASISGADCELEYDYQNASAITMTYNATTELYEHYASSGFLQGSYDYNVTCNGVDVGFGVITKNETFTITNRPPYLYAPFPNLTIQAGTSVSGYDLNDYFKDNDLDALTFTDTSTSVIDIDITALGIVTITPNPTIQGNYTVRFTASDGIDTNQSNPFIITVLPRSFPPPSNSGGGGGGGGGGSPPPSCEPDWSCNEWGRCLTTGIQQRSCTDLNNCSTVRERPELVRDCEYVGTCSDSIKNCHDGLCELGVDCGGPCDACATCYDGILNQNEEEVDCGGVCDACEESTVVEPGTDRPSPIDQIPEELRRASYVGFATALLAIILMILASLYLHKNLFKAVGRWASQLVAPPDHHVSEHAQYVIGVEVAYDKHRNEGSFHDFVSTVADRTGELLTWLLDVDAEYTFEEMRKVASESDLDERIIESIDKYTRILETALYGGKGVSSARIVSGAYQLAARIEASDAYEEELEAAKTLKRPVKERLLTQLTDALDVLLEHERNESARLLIDEADALAEGLKKGEVLDRYTALRAKVIR